MNSGAKRFYNWVCKRIEEPICEPLKQALQMDVVKDPELVIRKELWAQYPGLK